MCEHRMDTGQQLSVLRTLYHIEASKERSSIDKEYVDRAYFSRKALTSMSTRADHVSTCQLSSLYSVMVHPISFTNMNRI